MIKVIISKALLCIAHVGCYPVLIGHNTPVGDYTMTHVILENSGKREDVLMIKESSPGRIIAIHTPPNAHRKQLLDEQSTAKVTLGCINVSNELFYYLVNNFNESTITIEN